MAKKKLTTNEYSFTVIYEPVKGGGYQVSVPLLSGLITYGRNFEEAKIMARDAIVCYLESLKKDKEKIPTEKSLLQEKITVSIR
ncbi:MAG: type II toxin-antitoxin system HicB family antitoxin [Patescibacteria group bacterium]